MDLRGTVFIDMSLLTTRRFRDVAERPTSPERTLIASPTALRCLTKGSYDELRAYRPPFRSSTTWDLVLPPKVDPSPLHADEDAPHEEAIANETLQALGAGAIVAARRWPVIELLVTLGVTVEIRSPHTHILQLLYDMKVDADPDWLAALDRRTRFWLHGNESAVNVVDAGRSGYY